MSEETELKQFVIENPRYFYDIIPYAISLGISKKIIKKFENILAEVPENDSDCTKLNFQDLNIFTNSIYNDMIVNSVKSSFGR